MTIENELQRESRRNAFALKVETKQAEITARSNKIREGTLTREEALELCQQDNKTKYDTLKNFSDVIGFNLDNVLSKINCLDRLY